MGYSHNTCILFILFSCRNDGKKYQYFISVEKSASSGTIVWSWSALLLQHVSMNVKVYTVRPEFFFVFSFTNPPTRFFHKVEKKIKVLFFSILFFHHRSDSQERTWQFDHQSCFLFSLHIFDQYRFHLYNISCHEMPLWDKQVLCWLF